MASSTGHTHPTNTTHFTTLQSLPFDETTTTSSSSHSSDARVCTTATTDNQSTNIVDCNVLHSFSTEARLDVVLEPLVSVPLPVEIMAELGREMDDISKHNVEQILRLPALPQVDGAPSPLPSSVTSMLSLLLPSAVSGGCHAHNNNNENNTADNQVAAVLDTIIQSLLQSGSTDAASTHPAHACSVNSDDEARFLSDSGTSLFPDDDLGDENEALMALVCASSYSGVHDEYVSLASVRAWQMPMESQGVDDMEHKHESTSNNMSGYLHGNSQNNVNKLYAAGGAMKHARGSTRALTAKSSQTTIPTLDLACASPDTLTSSPTTTSDTPPPKYIIPKKSPNVLTDVRCNNKKALDARWPRELMNMSTKELNVLLRTPNHGIDDVKELKAARRRNKSIKYSRVHREKFRMGKARGGRIHSVSSPSSVDDDASSKQTFYE